MTHYKKSGEVASTSTRWAFARYFTAIQVFFAIVVFLIILVIFPELSALSSSVGMIIIAAVSAVYLVVVFLASRYFFGFGINNAEKAAKKMPGQ